MDFIKSNPHPKGKKIGDCVIRAIAYGEGKKWLDVYQALCGLGAILYDMPNSKPVYESYLITNGWIKNKMPKNLYDGRRIKLKDFIETNPNLNFIASITRHIVYVESGKLIDTWNCGNKCVGNYYTKN